MHDGWFGAVSLRQVVVAGLAVALLAGCSTAALSNISTEAARKTSGTHG